MAHVRQVIQAILNLTLKHKTQRPLREQRGPDDAKGWTEAVRVAVRPQATRELARVCG